MSVHSLEAIGALAVEAMLFEVSATPKPGLVDRNNNGAHHDMNFFTFMSSAAALRGSFDEFARLGYAQQQKPLATLLPLLRQQGQVAERQMFAMTGGVNTHKGMIFSLGILCGVAGWALGRQPLTASGLCAWAGELCRGICAREYAGAADKKQLTKGEAMYVKYGVTGVRGEVEAAFPTVQKVALPVYTRLRQAGCPVNEALVDTLLHLLAYSADTNILGRHDWETLLAVQTAAKAVLKQGSIHTAAGRQAILDLDADFITRYISPGGSADLVAVTHFLYSMEQAHL